MHIVGNSEYSRGSYFSLTIQSCPRVEWKVTRGQLCYNCMQ